jgi:hypothetical protein
MTRIISSRSDMNINASSIYTKVPSLPKSSSCPALFITSGAFNQLPNELIIHIMKFSSTPDLLYLRSTNNRLFSLSNTVLSKRLIEPNMLLKNTVSTLNDSYNSLSTIKRPQLDHYRQFLSDLSSSELTEAIWYTFPPHNFVLFANACAS